MTIREVTTNQLVTDFLTVPKGIYQNDPNWIQPLDHDIEEVFSKKTNKTFKHGACTRWVLYNDHGEPAGRVAAFINYDTAHHNPQPTGGMGFFECIDDQNAAFLLFDTCKTWLQDRGMEAMDGPVNFGERDAWWGMLVEGFHPVPYKMNYNPPYYQRFFENYGFRDYFKQFCFTMNLTDEIDPVFHRQHDYVARNHDFRAVHLEKKYLDKYADDFCTIFNRAWEGHNEGRTLERQQIRTMFRKMKPILDETLIWFAYLGDEPIAFWINIPDLNEVIRDFNGKFGLWQKLQLVFKAKFGTFHRFSGFVFGVVPEYQATGVVGFLIVEGAKVIKALNRYTEYEMQWQGDFNPRMVRIGQTLAKKRSRMLITYRKLFHATQPFERHPVLKSRHPVTDQPKKEHQVS